MSSSDEKYHESLVQQIETINYNSFLKTSFVSSENDDSATQHSTGAKTIQKSKEEEWAEKRQAIISAEITSSGALLLKITFKAAGFIIGDKGASIRSVCSRTGASSNSWTSSVEIDGEMQAIRVCKIVGEDNEVLFNTLRIVKAAADRYDELIQGVCREKFVAKTQIVEGIRFEYKPPPLKLVSTATRTFKAPSSREQNNSFCAPAAIPNDFFAPSTQTYLPLQAAKSVPSLGNVFFSPRHLPTPIASTPVYTPRNVHMNSPFVSPRNTLQFQPAQKVDYFPPSQLVTPRQSAAPFYPQHMPHSMQQMQPLPVSKVSSAPNLPTPRQYSVRPLESVQSAEAINQHPVVSNPMWQNNFVPQYPTWGYPTANIGGEYPYYPPPPPQQYNPPNSTQHFPQGQM